MNIENRTIYCRDNIDVLVTIDTETVDMIYLDPPFNKNKSFTAPLGSTASGASFKDIFYREDYKEEWKEEFKTSHRELYDFLSTMPFYAKDSDVAYIAYMAKRVIECHRILKPTGSFFYHCDDTMQHYIKVMLDIIFGREHFINEINWRRYQSKSLKTNGFSRVTDAILYYQKSKKFSSNPLFVKLTEDIKSQFPYVEEKTGRRFQTVALEQSSNYRFKGEKRVVHGQVFQTDLGWRWSQKTFDERMSENPNIIYYTRGGKIRYKFYADQWKGKPLTDLWINIPTSKMTKKEKQGYPTQKPLVLLERLIENATNPGDLILDPFCGCATTCVAAEKLERKWVGIDISHLAYRLVEERLVKEVQGYSQETKQPDMFGSQKKLHFKTEPPIRSKDEVKLSKWVYVISNPKHPNEFKVGITSDYKKRLGGYQTSDPSRAYKIEFKVLTDWFIELEKHIHSHFEAEHEWVAADLRMIITEIKNFLKNKV